MSGERDRLVELLRPAEPWPGAPSPETIADTLMPFVDRIARERAAAELWEVADSVRNQHPGYIGRIDSADSIDARAAALRASNGEGAT